jgi:hypothetical protein
MNVEIGAEAAQFPEKEYINGIAFAVWMISLLVIMFYPIKPTLIRFYKPTLGTL